MRQVSEADEKLGDSGDNVEADKLVQALSQSSSPGGGSFGDGSDGAAFRLESLYSRTGYISGAPLTNGYTFGQTQSMILVGLMDKAGTP